MKTEIHGGKSYKVSYDGTYYSSETPDEVIEILERARKEKTRLKLYYGDKETGRDYLEEHDTIGKIGRSTGTIKIPLILSMYNSTGGPALFDNGIVKIVTSPRREILWCHPRYHQPSITMRKIIDTSLSNNYSHELIVNGEVWSRHENERSAMRLRTKLL